MLLDIELAFKYLKRVMLYLQKVMILVQNTTILFVLD